MLIRFAARNHRSIHERQELSMVPSNFYKERPEVLIPCAAVPRGHLLPAAVIYGPNASGKSNIVRAIGYLSSSVENSQVHLKPNDNIPRQPFALNARARMETSSVEVEFALEGIRYQYGFESNDEAFGAEWLYWFPHRTRQVLFERIAPKDIRFGRNLRGQNKVISELMRPNSLFLSAAAQNGHDQLSVIQQYLANIQSAAPGIDPSVQSKEGEYDQRIIEFLSRVGTGIIGSRVKRIERPEEQQIMLREVMSVIGRHLGSDQKAVADIADQQNYMLELAHASDTPEPVYLNVSDESAGTRRLLRMLVAVFSALDEGSILIIDELDASLHTQICEGIVGLFSDRDTNPNGAQLIATTHDTNLMRSRHLRRDQLWFTEKGIDGATNLYPLSDIRTRKTDDIEKGYLQGRYGALPFAGSLPDLLSG